MPFSVPHHLPVGPKGTNDLSSRLRPSTSPPARFRALLARRSCIPGAHNGLAAQQAKSAGFEALYLSGAAMTASMGLPDLGIITVDEVCFFIRQIARASGLPVLVDGDTGYGEALNVMHMVRSFEDAGAAAVHIEDQLLPKKCGHLNDKKLADAHDMAAKVAAASHGAAQSLYHRPHRCRRQRRHGRRRRPCELYMEAGADAIFPEALHDAEMFREFARRMPGRPLLANMTEFGRTPFFTAAEFEAMGYRMVIWPVCSCESPPWRRKNSTPRSSATAAPTTASTTCKPAPSSTPPSPTTGPSPGRLHRRNDHPHLNAPAPITDFWLACLGPPSNRFL